MFAAKGDENMAKKRANGEGSIRSAAMVAGRADTVSTLIVSWYVGHAFAMIRLSI